jgi:FOG: Ankyrin repeat
MAFYDIFGYYMHGQGTREEVLALYEKYSRSSGDLSELINISVRYADHEALSLLLKNGLRPCNDDLVTLASRTLRSDRPKDDDVYKTAILLIDAKIDPHRKDEGGNACYHLAARYGDGMFLKALHDKKVRLTSSDERDRTCLHLVCEYCYNSIKDKAKYQESINKAKAENNSGVVASLGEAVSKCDEKLDGYFLAAKVLLDAGVDLDQLNSMQEKALALAIRNGAKKIAALLSGDLVEDDPTQDMRIEAGGMTLHEAALNNDPAALEAIIKLGADVNEISDDERFKGMTPLGVACGFLRHEIVDPLLKNGADPNYKDSNGSAALAYMMSYRVRNLHRLSDDVPRKIIKAMKDNGFDINGKIDEFSNTLITRACGSNEIDITFNRDSFKLVIVEEAVRVGADVNAVNNFGQTPLMLISVMNEKQTEDIQRFLLLNGADLSKKDQSGSTALMYACCNGNPRKAKELVEAMMDSGDPLFAAVNNEQKTALDYATERNNEPLVNLLLREIR